MHTGFNNLHEVSPCFSRILHHHFWQEIRTIKGIKSPPNPSPQVQKNSNPSLSKLKDNHSIYVKTLTLNLQGGGLRLEFAGQFVTHLKHEHASNYVHFWEKSAN